MIVVFLFNTPSYLLVNTFNYRIISYKYVMRMPI